MTVFYGCRNFARSARAAQGPRISGLSYSTPQTYPLNQAITPLKPTVTGTVTAYQVSPSLPQGLSLGTSTGVISGAACVVSSATTYKVSASNSAGSTSSELSITVKSSGSAPSIAYASPYYSFTIGAAAQVRGPAVSGGPITSWSVQPALPTGLSLSQTDGSILGTPAAGSSPTTNQVTALNTGGTIFWPSHSHISRLPMIRPLDHAVECDRLPRDGRHQADDCACATVSWY